MAIAVNSTSGGGYQGGSTALTYSHTVAAGSDLVLVVGVIIVSSSDLVTGVTYNGVSMTRANTRYQGVVRSYQYYLFNPATGAHNVVVSVSSSVDKWGVSVAYSGVDDAGVDSTVQTGANSGTTGALAFTTVADNAWTVAIANTEAGGSAPTPSTGSTARITCGTNAGFRIADSGAAVTPAGSYTMNWTFGTTTAYNLLGISLAPAVTTTVKTWNGIARANLKTLNGVASANIKTINGVT